MKALTLTLCIIMGGQLAAAQSYTLKPWSSWPEIRAEARFGEIQIALT